MNYGYPVWQALVEAKLCYADAYSRDKIAGAIQHACEQAQKDAIEQERAAHAALLEECREAFQEIYDSGSIRKSEQIAEELLQRLASPGAAEIGAEGGRMRKEGVLNDDN